MKKEKEKTMEAWKEIQAIEDNYVTPHDVGDALSLTYGRIVQLIHKGKINAKKLGRCWYIPKSELERMQKRTSGPSK